MKHLASIVLLVLFVALSANAQITVAANGNWSATATWTGGAVPGASDNVVIDSGFAVTVDIPDAVCNDITANGYLYFNEAVSGNTLTVNGNLSVGPYGRLRSSTGGTISAPRLQYITIMKNLTNAAGGSIDMRMGSNPNVSVGRITFAGDSNSEINLSRTAYSSNLEEFNTIEINKSEGAKVILASGNLFHNNNSSNSPDTLILTSGIIETQGTSQWVHLATSNTAVVGASDASYVNGILGRGISNTGTPPILRKFDVGDGSGYRPVTVRTQDVGGSTGHYVSVQAISGDANTGTSSLTGGIDKVSTVRYYRVTYTPSAFATIPLDRFDVEYQAADGVGSNNTDLRVAYSTDERATWIGMGQTVADTTFVTDQVIVPDSIVQASRPVLSNSNAVYVALARATGTTTNTLVGTTDVEEETDVPASFMLGQNYPNPFNPSTSIRFGLDKPGFTTVRVYDMLGRLVTTLAEGMMAPGFHTVTWNADGASSGLYFYTLQSGEKMQTRKMLLMK